MDDTLLLLDSEIARLVYGHLKDLKCDEVAEKFLHMSPHMKECVQLKNKNRNFLTRAHGLSLEEIFNQFINMNKLLLNSVNSRITNPNKKFHNSVAALQFIFESNKSSFEEKDDDTGFASDSKQKLDSANDEDTSDFYINLESSTRNIEDPKLIKQPHILNLYYADSVDTESDCTYENNDVGDDVSMKNVSRANFKKKVKVLRPRKSFPVAGKSISRSTIFDESEHNCNEQNETRAPRNEGTDYVNQKSNFTNTILSYNVKSKSVITDEQSTPVVNKNISEIKVKSSSPNASPITNDLLTPNVNETKCTRRLRSSTVEATEAIGRPRTLDTTESNVASSCSTKFSRTQRSRKKSSLSSHEKSANDGKPNTPNADTDPPVDFALIHQKLIETPQLHVRLAENINRMINESPRKKSSSSLSEELDLTVQKVADETVNDPLCQEIINELLACVPNINLLDDEETEKQDINMVVDDDNQEKENSAFENVAHDPAKINLDDTDTRYQEMQEFVRFKNDQQQSDIIIVEVPQDEQNLYSERNYFVDNQNNFINTNSVATANIRSYVMCPSDITGTDKTDENVVNMYMEQKQEEVLQLHGLESNSFLIGQNMPLIIGNNAKIMISGRKTRRSKCEPLNTSTRSRKYTPIAPKPCSEKNAATPANTKNSDTPKPSNKPMKKMKR